MIEVNIKSEGENKITLTLKIPESLYNDIAEKMHNYAELLGYYPTLLVLSQEYVCYFDAYFKISRFL